MELPRCAGVQYKKRGPAWTRRETARPDGRLIHMVLNELNVSPEVMDALAVAATAVLMLMSARFFLWLRELEDYARREGL